MATLPKHVRGVSEGHRRKIHGTITLLTVMELIR